MEKHFFLRILGFSLLLTPFFAISPTVLLAIATDNTGDADSTIASIELRAYERAPIKEDFQYAGDFDIPTNNRSVFFVPSTVNLKNFRPTPQFSAAQATTQIRAPPRNDALV